MSTKIGIFNKKSLFVPAKKCVYKIVIIVISKNITIKTKLNLTIENRFQTMRSRRSGNPSIGSLCEALNDSIRE